MISSSVHSPVKLHILRKVANLLLLLLLFALPSCKDPNKAEPPAGSVPKKEMVQALVDIHILEAYTENLGINKDSIQPELKVSYEAIYKKHKITFTQFQETFSWYEAHPEKLDALYQDVVAELSTREAQAKSQQKVIPPAVPELDTSNAKKLKVFGK